MYFLIFFFLTLSTALLNALPNTNRNGDASGDRFNFGSLRSRERPMAVAISSESTDGITLVDVSDGANNADPDTGFGMVFQEYSIGQTEVTAKQYCDYLNAVATGDNYSLFYNENMGSDPNVASIRREVIDGKNRYSVISDEYGDRSDFPIVYVNLYQAARFCNWLQNRDRSDLSADALTECGAYTLNGISSGPIARNPGATWFIPTEDEWYKPAYYKGGGLHMAYWQFSSRSDWAPSNSLNDGNVNNANYYCSNYTKQGAPYLVPANYFKGSLGAYNTYDMGGNVAEWVATEESQGAIPLRYVARGGSWKSSYYSGDWWGIELSKWSRPAYDPSQGYDHIGFRVASSLSVVPTAPATPAPGDGELSPGEMLGAPFMLAAGIGIAIEGKNIYKSHCSSATKSQTVEQRVESPRGRRDSDEDSIQLDAYIDSYRAEDSDSIQLITETNREDDPRMMNPIVRSDSILGNESGGWIIIKDKTPSDSEKSSATDIIAVKEKMEHDCHRDDPAELALAIEETIARKKIEELHIEKHSQITAGADEKPAAPIVYTDPTQITEEVDNVKRDSNTSIDCKFGTGPFDLIFDIPNAEDRYSNLDSGEQSWEQLVTWFNKSQTGDEDIVSSDNEVETGKNRLKAGD